MKALVLPSVLSILISACVTSKVDQDLATFDNHVDRLHIEFSKTPRDPSDKEWVKGKLKHMVEVDQYMRSYMNTPIRNKYTKEEAYSFREKFHKRWLEIDRNNTESIKKPPKDLRLVYHK